MASFFKNFDFIFDKPKVKKILLPENVDLEMIWVDPGTFTMGSPVDELGSCVDETMHKVTISKGFWLGKYPVTQAQYQAVMGNNPSYFEGENLPVEQVSWFEAINFCAKLTETEKAAGRLPDGYKYTLPTEAQWEYACRAGTNTALNSGKNVTDKFKCPNMDEVGWYYSNSNDSNGNEQIHPVRQKKPNYWGFYDMLGNVWEWCLDWYGGYPTGVDIDPTGPSTGPGRVLRGGCRHSRACFCRSAQRLNGGPGDRDATLGFRVALITEQSSFLS